MILMNTFIKLGLICFALIFLMGLSSAWFNYSLSYMIPFNLTTTSAITEHPTLIVFDTTSAISSGYMKSDCSDIRLYNSTGSLLKFGALAGCNSSNTRLYTNITQGASTTSEYYIYFGNSSATSVNSLVGVFPLNMTRFFPLYNKTTTDYALGYNLTENGSVYSGIGRRGLTAEASWFVPTSNFYGADTGLPSGSASQTICYWAWLNSTGSYLASLSYGTTAATNGVSYGNWAGTGNRAFAGITGSDMSGITNNFFYGRWAFQCSSNAGNNWKMYENGTYTNGKSMTTNLVLAGTSNGLKIANNIAGGNQWNGSIVEVMIFNRQLSDTEISRLYAVAEPSFTIGTITNSTAVIINSPSNNTFSTQANQILNFTPYTFGTSTFACRLYINETLNATNSSTENNKATTFNVAFVNGSYSWKVSCNDSGTWINSSTYLLTIDSISPVITLLTPFDNQYFNTSTLAIAGTSIDVNLNYTNISLYDSSYSILNSTTTTNSSWNVSFGTITNGTYFVGITGYDMAGNSANKTLFATKNLTWNSPLNGVDYDNNLTYSFTGGSAMNCSYNITGTTALNNSYSVNGSSYSTNHVLSVGTYGINLICISSTNASNIVYSDSRAFSVGVLPYISACNNASANINVSAVNELTLNELNMSYNFEVQYSIENGTYNSAPYYYVNASDVPFLGLCFTPRTNTTIAQFPVAVDISGSYGSTGYQSRSTMISGTAYSGIMSNLTLYLTNGTYYTFVIQDQYGNAIPEASFNVSFLGNPIQSLSTNIDGSALVNLNPLSTYAISIEKAGYTGLSLNFVAGTTTTIYIRLGKETDVGEYYFVYQPDAYEYSCTNSTNASGFTFNCSWEDRSGYLKYARMVCYNKSNEYDIVYNANSSASSGSLQTFLANTSNVYYCEYYMHFNTETLLYSKLLQLVSSIITSISNFKEIGVLFALVGTLGIGFLFVSTPALMILASGFAILIFSLIGFISMIESVIFVIVLGVLMLIAYIWRR